MAKFRTVKSSEIALCPQLRLSVSHWIPRHMVEECGGRLRVLVCGNLNWSSTVAMRRRLEQLPAGTIVIHGAARGADQTAGMVSRQLGFEVQEFPADWKRYGRGAGPRRNRQMLDQHPDLVLTCFGPEGPDRGTTDTMTEARRRGIPLEEIR